MVLGACRVGHVATLTIVVQPELLLANRKLSCQGSHVPSRRLLDTSLPSPERRLIDTQTGGQRPERERDGRDLRTLKPQFPQSVGHAYRVGACHPLRLALET